MTSSLPILLIVTPLALALLTLMLGRWPAVARGVGLVGALAVVLLTLIARPAIASEPTIWTLAGRTFEFAPFVAQIMALLAGGTAILYLLQWQSPGPAAVVPGGLAALGLLAASLMVRPFAFGAVGLLAATAVAVPALYGGRFTSAATTWRAFLPIALSVPLLIAAGWLLDSGQAQSQTAEIVLLLASLLLLGGFPFYAWLTGVARRASLPAVTLFVGIVGAGMSVWLGLVLDEFPVARGSTLFQTAVLGSALLSSVIAAFGLTRAKGWRDMLTYGLVFDAGLQVAALAIPGPSLAAVLAVGTIGRLVALLLLTSLLSSSEPEPEEGPNPLALWPRLALAFGAVGLLGLPLTLSFTARWATLPFVAGRSAPAALIILIAMGIAAVALVRWALANKTSGPGQHVSSRFSQGISLGLFFLALFMGFIGPHLLEYLTRLLTS